MAEAEAEIATMPDGIDPALRRLADTSEAERLAKCDVTRGEAEALTRAVLQLQKSLIRAHQKLIELEADMIPPEKRSALILPDRMTN